MKKARVDLAGGGYEVLSGAGTLRHLPKIIDPLKPFERVVLISDETVARLHGESVAALVGGSLAAVVVEAGEKSKSLASAQRIFNRLADLRVSKRDLIVSLGGGMITDLAGFVASTYMRGIRVVHLPTTLLAQVDAAIGGKTSVNLQQAKNLVGTYHQPTAVICDTRFLSTLPDREYRSGLAEVIKYALCYEGPLLETVRERVSDVLTRKPAVVDELVARCVAIKAGVVAQDERDASARLVLNYGHTYGHALEASARFEELLHGEAVGVGMVFAAAVARSMGWIGDEVMALHVSLLRSVGLPTSSRAGRSDIESAWSLDKKRAGQTRWVLLRGIGKPEIVQDVPGAALDAAFAAVEGTA